MFGGGILMFAVMGLAMLSAGGIAYALLFSKVESEQKTTKRLEAIAARAPVAERKAEPGARKRNLQDALKEFEEKQQAKTKQVSAPPLSLKLQQAGLAWTRKTFTLFSLGCAVALAFLGLLAGMPTIVLVGMAAIGGLGMPRWMISFLRKRRMKKFIDELPNAVDIIVRGIRSGLPVTDCLRIIANESREPVRSEFRQIVESQQLGIPVGDACLKLYERMPVQEANFFGIVIQIQQKAGGNLSETLGNLSRVLRDRKKMRAKIAAMSMEAKASAAIIGSLPIIVTGLVYLTSPTYIAILFTTKMGNVIVLGGLLYMFIGIMVMRKMINIDI